MVNFIANNEDSLIRLRQFAAGLTPDALRKEVGAGWTVAGLLLHMAFWDRRASTLLARWAKDGVDDSPIDGDVVNDSLKDLLQAIPPESAMRIALQAAEEVDGAIAGLGHSIIVEIESKPTHFKLDRAHHRTIHLDEMERALQRARRAAAKS